MVLKKHIVSITMFSILASLFFSAAVFSQAGAYFGQNKVQYKKFNWKVFRTEHFDVHYYPEEEEAAHDAARMAERGYDYLSEAIDHKIEYRIPLILYASLNDFQQTNVIGGLLNQGTRGVTEGLKNRVVLPITGSYREFHHVLVHELVHVFQFDLMLHTKEIEQNKRFNPPLWFVEGMAEYLSNGMDNTTRMWVRDGLAHDNLMTVEQLNSVMDIRVYRLGQSLWHYIGETHGKKTVGKIFKSAVRSGNIEAALARHLGVSMKQLTDDWHTYAQSIATPKDSTLHEPHEIADQLTRRRSFYHRMNLAPSVSPDGKHIVFVANRNLQDEIFMMSEDEEGGYESKHLVKGGGGKQFETLRFFDTTIGWSRDGQHIAFVSKAGKYDVIYVMNPHTKKLVKKLLFKDLNGLTSPTFSPEGDRLAFVGISGGISDLYVVDTETEDVTPLTNDKYTVLHPSWSPDGQSIAYVSDRGAGTDEQKLLFGDYDLAIYHFEDQSVEMISEVSGTVINPQWSSDGSEIAFISDHLGIPNIYRMNLNTKEIITVTELQSGVSGITESTPAFSWSADGQVMVFTAFYKNNWHIYKLDKDKIYQPQDISPVLAALSAGGAAEEASAPLAALEAEGSAAIEYDAEADSPDMWLPELIDPNHIYSGYDLEPEDSVEARKYSKKLHMSGINVGGGYSSFYGVTGGATVLFSDMLGNRNLFLSTAMQFNNPLHSDLSATYFNQGGRISWGAQLFQSNIEYLNFGSFNQIGFVRNTYRGANGLISYPFNRFTRVELSAGWTVVDQDQVFEQYTFSGRDRETFDINTFNFGQVGGALVFDNTVYGLIGPMSGSRSRLSVETTSGDYKFTFASVDYRRYFRVNSRSALAWRFLGGASFGEDKQVYSIGGPYSYRGSDFNQLFGSKFFFSNLEYRFPLLPFFPPQYDMLLGVAFIDAAAAWDTPGRNDTFRPFDTANGFRLNDLNAAMGVGARLNIGYFMLGFDVAWPTDARNLRGPIKKFSFGTFF